MYFHNGHFYDVGQTILTVTGTFGIVEITFQERENLDMPGKETYVNAFAIERKLSGEGQSVESALVDLYTTIAKFDAMKDAGTL